MTSNFDGFALLAWAQLWQVTIVALGIGALVRLCCRDRPRLAYALWMLVVVKSIVPPVSGVARPASSVGRWPAAWRRKPMFAGEPAASLQSAHAQPLVSMAARRCPVDDIASRRNDDHSATDWDHLNVAILSIWAAGLVLCTAFVLAKQIVCAILIRRSSLPVDERYIRALAELSRRLGVKRHVRLIVTSTADRPGGFRSGPALDLDAAKHCCPAARPSRSNSCWHTNSSTSEEAMSSRGSFSSSRN